MKYVENKEYKIGDICPENGRAIEDGWVFYDKGSYGDGWRYLSAFPKLVAGGSFEKVKKEANRWKYLGWRMPTKEELNLLYESITKNDKLKANIKPLRYWSATTEIMGPYKVERIWTQDLYSGDQSPRPDTPYGQAGFFLMMIRQC
jgi:hypothetical protein